MKEFLYEPSGKGLYCLILYKNNVWKCTRTLFLKIPLIKHSGWSKVQSWSILMLKGKYWSLLNWRNLRFWCGFVAVLVNWNFVVISPMFAIFKKVVHSLILVRHPNTRRLTRLQTMCNVLKYCEIFKNGLVRLRCGCGFFSIY